MLQLNMTQDHGESSVLTVSSCGGYTAIMLYKNQAYYHPRRLHCDWVNPRPSPNSSEIDNTIYGNKRYPASIDNIAQNSELDSFFSKMNAL
jgi:hypothetical protein